MSKWDEQILVVNRKELFNNEENHFYGFIEKNDEKTEKIIATFESYEVNVVVIWKKIQTISN